MPSLEEQDAVVWYVLKRPLVRPNTSYKKAALCISLFLLANVGMTVVLYHLFRWLGISSFLPDAIWNFYREHQIATILLLTLTQFFIGSRFAGTSSIKDTSRSPYRIIASVLGIGVALITST